MSLSLSVIVPTIGRPTLGRLLESVNPGPEDEVLLVGDTNLGDTDYIVEMAVKFACRLIWSERSSVGGTALRNFAIPLAQGDYIVFNDDTDVFTPNALETVRNVAQSLPEPCPMLFKVQLPGDVIWRDTPTTGEGEVDGHQFVVPNIPDKLGEWALNGHGDFYFIKSTLEKWGGSYVPVDFVIADCAP